jgi:hypothetical protein
MQSFWIIGISQIKAIESVVVLAIATLDLDSAYVQLVFIADFLVDLIP